MASIFGFTDSKRSIYLFDPIFSYTAESLIKDLLKMNAESKDEINIFINSPGGVVTDALGVIDVMKLIESPINTIILGSAASAASLIAACGDKRFISENSEVMIHEAAMQISDVSTRDGELGKALDMLDKINNRINSIYAYKTGKSLEEISSIMGTKEDVYMTAQEAISFGLSDTILSSEEISKIKLSETINLSETFDLEDSKSDLKKVHLLKVCSIEDRGINITKEMLEGVKSNFDSNIRGIDIALDCNTHDNDEGEKPAAAWLKTLEISEDGLNLYGMVELTDTGKKITKGKEFKYLSVELSPIYQDESGKMHNNVLLGGTFTNRPAVKGLDPIKLSETKNIIDMKLSNEEIGSIEAFKGMSIEIKDIHKSFMAIKAENEALESEKGELLKAKSELEEKAAELEASKKEADEALEKVAADKIEAEKAGIVQALVEKGIIANSHKEKVLKTFSSKSEIEDFYKDVPASIKVKATGLDSEDINGLDSKLAEMSKRTGHSVEDIKKYGLIK